MADWDRSHSSLAWPSHRTQLGLEAVAIAHVPSNYDPFWLLTQWIIAASKYKSHPFNLNPKN